MLPSQGEPAAPSPADPDPAPVTHCDLAECQPPASLAAAAAADTAGDVPGTVAVKHVREVNERSEHRMLTPHSKCKMRVSVRGRNRIITLSNKHDVTQTIQDLFAAGNAHPLEYYKDVDSFKMEYNLRARRLTDAADSDGENVQLADVVRAVHDEALRLMRELRPELDRVWRRALVDREVR